MGDHMQCPFCLTQDIKYFKEGVCRRCIHLRYGVLEEDDFQFSDNSEYTLSFTLTPYQQAIAQKVVTSIQTQNVFLEAVCGAGKTEMCYDLIRYALDHNLKIGWAIPRRQVVIELAKRIDENFQACKVVAVCQGQIDDLMGDIVICTTHQLYRYRQYFDILIVDEPDAFPFNNNDLLFDLMRNSVRGKILFMSATKDEAFIKKIKDVHHLVMPLRPNLKPLPIPIHRRSYLSLVKDFKKIKKEKLLIFVPTIKMAQRLSRLTGINYISSKTEDKDEMIHKFKNGEIMRLISTTILERGMTFENCYVFVLNADHPIFDASSLIQISGRVRRGFSHKGDAYFYTQRKCEEVETCIQSLNKMNQYAEYVLKNGF